MTDIYSVQSGLLTEQSWKRREGNGMKQEEKVLKMLAQCWNEFLKLEVQHPTERREFCDGIHRCQDIIAVRVARKYRPDMFPNKGIEQ